MKWYPALTRADIRACSLFIYLRAIGQIGYLEEGSPGK